MLCAIFVLNCILYFFDFYLERIQVVHLGVTGTTGAIFARRIRIECAIIIFEACKQSLVVFPCRCNGECNHCTIGVACEVFVFRPE